MNATVLPAREGGICGQLPLKLCLGQYGIAQGQPVSLVERLNVHLAGNDNGAHLVFR